MWDWSGSKIPPPMRSRDEAAQQAQNQGVTPVRRDIRSVPIYRDPRAFRSLPPTAPASAYPDPLDIPQPPYPNAPVPPPGYPHAPQPMPPNYSQPYPPQAPMYPQPAPAYPPQPAPYSPPQPAPAGGWGSVPPPQPPYMPQPQAPYPPQPQPYAPPMPPQPQMPSYPQPGPMPRMAHPLPSASSSYQTPQNAALPTENAGDRSMWEWQMSQMDLPNMELLEVNYVMLDPRWRLELRKAFKRARRDFLKYVGYHHVNELLSAGIDEEGIRKIKKGKAPENFNVHVRVPFDYGGTNDFSNLVLIQTHPFHVAIHKFIDMQTLSQPQGSKPRRLFIPAPKGKVYIPGVIEISSGGKDKHDRSVYAGFLESTFEIIAQKSVMGR